ncbi:MAG: type II methionyl aminopeptidase [Candidatus Lokiarchaeota archaeon]|nr:type II methionyl aminopeptidase [Candidatus Harpocratesius repetitus]
MAKKTSKKSKSSSKSKSQDKNKPANKDIDSEKPKKDADLEKKENKAQEPSTEKKEENSEETSELSEEELAKQEEEKEKQLRLDSFRKAGEIHKKVVEFIRPQVKVGAKYLDLCEAAEAKIIELGGEIGFPTNICVNEVAAHYTSPPDDEHVIKEGDIVKVDIGVAVEGYTADGAFTVSFNKDPETQNLITAVETAVMKGLSLIKPGVKANEVGKETQKIIKGFGYNPIPELSGHSIERWQVHGGKEIPNVAAPSGITFEEGDVFALECFASTGTGNISRAPYCYIYEYNISADRVPFRGKVTRKVMGWIGNKKKSLPFSTRELIKEFRTGKFAIRELTNSGKLYQHHVLREKKGIYVSQFEHTFLVTADGIEQLT